jgi:signal transduction histidine kinase/ActR/RegA family two-component response regulator
MLASSRHALIVAVAACYFLGGKLGLEFFGLVHPSASAVWPPTGIAIAALLVLGYRVWPAILAGAFLVNVTTAGSIPTSLGIAVGNTLEGILAAYLVHRFAGGPDAFAHARDILKFAGLAAMLSTTVSATIGVTSLTLTGHALPSELGAIWLTWWLGDAAGAILVAPLLVLWYRDPSWTWKPKRAAEAALLLLTTIGTAVVVFFEPVLEEYPLAFLCLPPLAWAAFRFRQREVAVAVAVLALIATWATASGSGPFAMQTANESLLVLQAFMAVMAMTALPMAALVNERDALVARAEAAREQAEVASRSKDEFLAMLGHELRNPLGAMTAAMAVLDRTDEPAPEALRWRRVMRRQVEHLTHLIDDLLDTARITAGKMTLKREPLEVAVAVERCVQAIASSGLLQRDRIDVESSPVWVNADRHRLEQIVTNLVTNAMKHTPPEGSIRVCTFPEGDDAVIRVEDTGAGIASELLPKVFDAFTQGKQGIERAGGGLGVGLTLVRRFAELHGGGVEARSAGPGAGSTFVVRLPRIEAPAAARAGGTRVGEASKHVYRILVVEDNEDARQALRVLLEIMGHEVHEAVDGESGIAAALRLRPDFVVVDIGLPRLDGYEVARRLRAALPRVGLVALSGYGREEDKQRAKEAGFDSHLLKPTGGDRLQAEMDALHRRAGLTRAR